jgi:hypothetical protein
LWPPIFDERVQIPVRRKAINVPSCPDIDPQFFELAASPWLRSAVVRADAET